MAKVLDDLTSEILSYLPVKSLLRFQSLSKSWYSLIHSPRFIKSHLQQSPKTNSNSILVTLVKSKIGDFAQSHLCIAGIGSLDKLLENNPGVDNIKVHGSCNGLICLSILNHYLVLSNMSTKEFLITPIPIFGPMRRSKFHYGFGYDSVNDDYKIVVIFLWDDHFLNCFAQSRIYSMRYNVWSGNEINSIGPSRLFSNQGLPSGVTANGVFVCGSLHWVTQKNHIAPGKISSSISILAFDLATKGVHEILLPDYLQNKTRKKEFDIRVGVFGDCLCLSSKDGIDQEHEVWVMKDYMVQESWTILFHVSTTMVTEDYMLQDYWTKHFQNSRSADSLVTALTLVGSRGDHELLLGKPSGGFYWYNLEKAGELRYGGICGYGFYTAVICLGTLVSISDYNALWKEFTKQRRRKRAREEIDDPKLFNRALKCFYRIREKFNRIQSSC